jgi:hypothetical protein
MKVNKSKYSRLVHRPPIGLLALVLITLAAVFTAEAQTTLAPQLILRPVSNDDISAYKLPSTTQRSGGLTTVGLGQPAYLEVLVDKSIPAPQIGGVVWTVAGPADSTAALEDGPLGANVPSYEPSDRVSFQVAGRKMLRPDVAGRYLVTASVTTATGGTVDIRLTIEAATYVGIKVCTSCHSRGPESTPWSMVEAWSKTSHSTIFKDGMNGVASDHYSANCLGCHTVGYDLNATKPNGGFNDVAAQLNWKFPAVLSQGTYDALPDAIKNVGNIQCENCHGPGSKHVANGGSPLMISVSTASGDCGQCHGALTHHFKSGEWVNSRHAVATRDPSGAGREGCVGCHTSNGFIGKMKGVTPLNTAYGAINCQTCHEPHGRTNPANSAHLLRTAASVKLADGTIIDDGGKGQLCMNCHMSRQNAAVYAVTTQGSARFGPHHGPQADMLKGTNGFTYGKKIPSSAHGSVVEDTCVGCHMQVVGEKDPGFTNVGGHTFKAGWDGGGTQAAVNLVGTCQKCHGKSLDAFDFTLFDYNGDGVIEGVQTEVQRLLDQLAEALPPVGKPKAALSIDSTWSQTQLKAAYNYQFVKEDGSFGIHNTAYAVGLLKASIADLAKSGK